MACLKVKELSTQRLGSMLALLLKIKSLASANNTTKTVHSSMRAFGETTTGMAKENFTIMFRSRPSKEILNLVSSFKVSRQLRM